MPCRDYDFDSYSRTDELKNRLDEHAKLLCEACGKIDPKLMSESLRKWYEKHLENDMKEQDKIKEEKRKKEVKQKALKKLTPEEKKLLGL